MNLKLNRWQIQGILSLIIAYCSWGLWDTANFNRWSPGQLYPMPFFYVQVE